MNDKANSDRLQAIAEDFVQAYNAKDFDRLRGLLSSKFHFEHHNRDFVFEDADEFVATLRHFAGELMPDRGFGPPSRVITTGNTVVREHGWSGVPTEDIPGMAAAGERLSLDLCSVFVFDGDLVAEYHDYG